MSRLEGENRLVQDFEIPILAEVLGVSVEWLLCGDDDTPTENLNVSE